jgi:hypothetical protein
MSSQRIPFTAHATRAPRVHIMRVGGRGSTRDRKHSKRKQEELDGVAEEANERERRRVAVTKRAKRPAAAAFVPLPSGTRVQANASSFDLKWAKNHFGKDWKKQVLYGTL